MSPQEIEMEKDEKRTNLIAGLLENYENTLNNMSIEELEEEYHMLNLD